MAYGSGTRAHPVEIKPPVEDDGARIVENPGIPVIYTDGVADVEIQGDNVRVIYFEYRTVLGKRVKSPVVEMIRPLKTCGNGALAALIARKLALIGRAHH